MRPLLSRGRLRRFRFWPATPRNRHFLEQLVHDLDGIHTSCAGIADEGGNLGQGLL